MNLWNLLSTLALALADTHGAAAHGASAPGEKPGAAGQPKKKLGTAQAKEGAKWAAALLKKPSTQKKMKKAGKAGLAKVREAVEEKGATDVEILQRVRDCGDNCDLAATQEALATQLKLADFGEAEAMLTAMYEAFTIVNAAVKTCQPSMVLSGVNTVVGAMPGLSNDSFEGKYKMLVAKKEQAAAFVRDALCPALKECLLDEGEGDEQKLELYVEYITDRSLPGCVELYSKEAVGRLEKIGDSVVDGARGTARIVRKTPGAVVDGVVGGGKFVGNGGMAVGKGIIGGVEVGANALGDAAGGAWNGMKGLGNGMKRGLGLGGAEDAEHIENLQSMLQIAGPAGLVAVELGAECALDLGAAVEKQADCAGCDCVPLVLDSAAGTLRLSQLNIYVDPTDRDWSGVKKHAANALVLIDEVNYVASLADAAKGLSGPMMGVAAVVTAATGGLAAPSIPVMALVGGLMDLRKKRHEHIENFDSGYCHEVVELIGVEAEDVADLEEAEDAALLAEEEAAATISEQAAKLSKQEEQLGKEKQLNKQLSARATTESEAERELKAKIEELEAKLEAGGARPKTEEELQKEGNAAPPVALACVVALAF